MNLSSFGRLNFYRRRAGRERLVRREGLGDVAGIQQFLWGTSGQPFGEVSRKSLSLRACTLSLSKLLIHFALPSTIFACAIMLAQHAHAWGPQQMGTRSTCDIFISGVITETTFERVVAEGNALLASMDDAYARSSQAIDGLWPPVVCLDSPGGSYIHGIALARYVNGQFATRIPREADCFSSCALVFMAGTMVHPDEVMSQRWYEEERDSPRPDRVLHPSATLGFHAPYLPEDGLPETLTPAQAVQDVQFASSFLLSEAQNMTFPAPLIGEMLRRGPDEYFELTRVGHLNAWEVGLSVDFRPDLSDQLLRNACYLVWNNHSYSEGGFGRLREHDTGLAEYEGFETFSSGWLNEPYFGTTDDGSAFIMRENVGSEASFFCTLIQRHYYYELVVGSGDFVVRTERLEGWQLLAPITEIRALGQ